MSSILTTNTSTENSSSFLTNLGNATVKIGTATGSNILATSAIKGQSINEVIAAQGGVDRVILNSALQIVGEAGAMQIGNAAHTGQITGGQQIALHAALGCGIGAGMSGGASGCAGGAAAGVIGELTADSLYQGGNGTLGNTNQARQIAISAGGLSGSIASLFTSIALGDDDSKVAKNIYAGNFLGTNAAANNATVVVTGTDKDQQKSSSKDLDQDFREAVEKNFDEKLTDFEWSGGNTKAARLEAAQKLYNIFENYEFAPGEKLNLIGFSHGGNVIKEFTQLYDGEKKIDNLIFLGTPHRVDYQVDLRDLNFYANRISVSDIRDGVQTRGYIDGSVYRGGITIPRDIRMMSGFINVRADQNLGPIANHINLPSVNIWRKNVEPYLINNK